MRVFVFEQSPVCLAMLCITHLCCSALHFYRSSVTLLFCVRYLVRITTVVNTGYVDCCSWFLSISFFSLQFQCHCFQPQSLHWVSTLSAISTASLPFSFCSPPLKLSVSVHTFLFFLFLQSLPRTSATFNDSELQPFLGCHRGAFNKVLHSFCSFLLILPCCCCFSPLFLPVISSFSEGKVDPVSEWSRRRDGKSAVPFYPLLNSLCISQPEERQTFPKLE